MTELRGYHAKELPEPISHFVDAIKAGDTVYLSGVVAVDSKGGVIGKDDPVEQARQAFRNLGFVLEAVGAKARNVAKITIYLKNVEHRSLINPVRKEFFGEHRPASTLVEISRLVYDDLLIEIDAIAVLD